MNASIKSETIVAAAVAQSLFITVPAVTLPNGVTVPSFQIGQYICAKGEDGKAIVSATAAPWVEINFADSKDACLAAGCNLITELQALAIAHDIVGVNEFRHC